MIAVLGAAIAGPAAPAVERTLSFVNTHTNERLTVTFKRDGHYVPEAMAQIDHILRDWRRNEVVEMDPRLIDLVWEVYQQTGATQPVYIICGYRAPQTNAMLRANSNGVAENSQHMYGNALDFFIPGVSLTTLRNVGLTMQIGGVGFYPTSGSPFVHLDVASVRNWPRLSRTELAQVFPDGRSLYIPSDGRPLPGYAEAQAAYEARGDQIVALYGEPSDPVTAPGARLAALFERNPEAIAPATTVPAAQPEAAPVLVALADPTIFDAPPLPRPNRDPIPGVTVTPPGGGTGEMPVMAYAPADMDHGDPLTILASPPPRPIVMANTGAAPAMAVGGPPPPAVVARPWDDPLARIAAPVMEGTALPIFDGAVTTRQAAFARIEAPSPMENSVVLTVPDQMIAVGFTTPDLLRSDRFDGALIRGVMVLDLLSPTTQIATR